MIWIRREAMLPDRLKPYRKLLVALAGAVVVGLTSYLGPDEPLVQTVTALLAALGVYAAPNEEP